MQKKKVYEYVDISDETPVQKLGLLDQIRVLFKKLSYDPAQELKRDDALTAEYLTLKATLIQFLDKATEPIRNGEKYKVNVLIASKFLPVYDEVLQAKRFSAFYNITIYLPENEYQIDKDFYVVMEAKLK